MQHQHCRSFSLSSWWYAFIEAAHKSEIVPDPPIKSAPLGKNGNGRSPGSKDGRGLEWHGPRSSFAGGA